jgi:hypothetical protein
LIADIAMMPHIILTIVFILPAATPERPDSNFKSIHQVQSQEHARDTLPPDTAAGKKPAAADSVSVPVPGSKTLSYATYFLVIILLLAILTVILILLRSRHKIKRE